MSDLSWTEPGCFEVVDGVHRVPLPLPMDGLRAVNVYLLETEQGLVLIDGGWAIAEAREHLDTALASQGWSVRDITRFLVTHAHRDHYTQAVVVGREVGATVSIGIGEKPSLDLLCTAGRLTDFHADRLIASGAEHLLHRWRAGQREAPAREEGWEYPDDWLTEDRTIAVGSRSLEAVHTPGHTQGHFVFADAAAGVLFAGDHVLPTITPSIGFEAAWVQQPLRDYLASLAKVRAMPDLRLLPAHGAVTESSHARIDALVAHHDERLARSLAAAKSGARTAWQVSCELPWTKRNKSITELGLFDSALAAFETLAHLELLAARGELTRTVPDGVVHFDPAPDPH